MENSKKNQLFTFASIAVVIFFGIFLVLFSVYKIGHNEKSPTSSIKVEIKTELYNKVTKPVDYGAPISTSEGFGRIDPFLPY